MAVLPYVEFPTARSGLGNGKVEGGIILPISFSVSGDFTILVMPEGDFLKNTVGSAYHAAFDFLVNVSHPSTSDGPVTLKFLRPNTSNRTTRRSTLWMRQWRTH